MQELKAKLDACYMHYNNPHSLDENNLDPLLIAKTYKQSPLIAEISLICALLSYGNVKAIVQTLRKLERLDFNLLKSMRTIIQKDEESFPYYRFQTRKDIKTLFIIIASLLENGGLKKHFLQVFKNPPASFILWNKSKNIYHARMIYSIYHCIDILYTYISKHHISQSKGINFTLGTSLSEILKTKGNPPSNASALKRWNMLLRWLVRKDEIDMGIWQDSLSPQYLILPLDTHTFRLCKKFRILNTKHANLQSALQATDTLALMCENDPVRYDFAIYRLGQNKIH